MMGVVVSHPLKALAEGRMAGRAGTCGTACPYANDTPERAGWMIGWRG
ncbi:ribosome modulation factor [Siccirubricoccus phaeus]|nr:Rmf/CrpP family protein [Siccirubricoccus phaeus]